MEYEKSRFDRRDYQKLYQRASAGSGLRSRIHEARYRDKRIQRLMHDMELMALHAPFEDLPLYINSAYPGARDIVQWRLELWK